MLAVGRFPSFHLRRLQIEDTKSSYSKASFPPSSCRYCKRLLYLSRASGYSGCSTSGQPLPRPLHYS
jgi:hypothetical protein